jgi:hypothetical protein
MMSTYKFVHREHLPIILDQGRLQFGKLSYYRRLYEEHGRRKWIGDPHEGRTEIFHDPIVAQAITPELSDVVARVGIRIAPGSRGTVIGNTKFVTSPDVHIFCASTGDIDSLRTSMCESQPNNHKPYDACLQISDPMLLAERIFVEGKLPQFEGAPVNGRFEILPFRSVSYQEVRTNAARGPVIVPSRYLKDSYFQSQAETRLVLRPKGRFDWPELLVVEISNPRDLFSEVPLK